MYNEEKVEASESLDKAISYLNETWAGFKPLYKLFTTEDSKLIFDTGTNKILSCEESAFFFLEAYQRNSFTKAIADMRARYSDSEVLSSLSIIKNTIESEGILQTDSRKITMGDEMFEKVEKLGKTHLPMISLEVTSRCNLRCMYCIYNKTFTYARSHSSEDMTWDTAKKSIDFFAANSRKAEELFITFYGGEPLLNLKLIEKSVDYAKDCFKGRNLNFSMTTNCTLIDANISRFLFKNDFAILASIDGPKDIHDEYRIDYKGKGTFDRAIKGLKMLVDVYGEGNTKIALNLVFTPPFAEEKINRIAQFIKDNAWLDSLKANITHAVTWSIPEEKMLTNKNHENGKSLFEWAEEQFIKQYSSGSQKNFLSKDTIEKSMLKLLNRHISDEPVYRSYPNGCCNPAVRKIFIEYDGKIRLCERMYTFAPIIGDVKNGIDFNLVKKTFVDEYFKMSNRDCSICWVGRLCSVCYVDTFEDKKYSQKKKRSKCSIVKRLTEKTLKLYTKLIKIDPEGLNYLADYKIL